MGIDLYNYQLKGIISAKADIILLRRNLCPCEIFGLCRNAHGQLNHEFLKIHDLMKGSILAQMDF